MIPPRGIASQPPRASAVGAPGPGRETDPLDLRPMDPRDDHDSLAGGVDCAACGELVPTGRIRILARRDDIVFVELACPTCRSDSLGIVIAEDGQAVSALLEDDREPLAVGPGLAYGEFGRDDAERFHEALPIAASDVDLVRRLLAERGLAALLEAPGPSERPPGPAW
jgi:hypothetical protein